MSSVRIYQNDRAGEVFVVRGTVGSWPYDCLQAVGNNDGTVSIRNKARSYADDSDFFELSHIPYEDIVKEDDSAWGASEVDTVNNLNAMFVDSPDTSGQPPTYTAATSITATDVEVLNYYASATGAVGWEWSSLPAGLAVSSHNPRQLVGTFSDGAGTYDVDVTAVNYYGSTTTTLTFTVTSTFADTKSVFFENQDYMTASATTSNPFYRSGNGSGSGDAWSVSVWFKPGTTNQRQTIVSFGGNDANNEGRVAISHNNNLGDRIRLHYGSNNNYLRLQTPGASLTDAQWHHIFVTYDGGTTGTQQGSLDDYYGRFTIWIDGVEQTTSNAHNNYGTSLEVRAENFFVGEESSGGAHLRGAYVNELAVWEGDESANVSDIYNSGSPHDLAELTSPPDHWWRMGDGDTYPTIQDNIGSLDFTMTNQTASNIVTDAP